MKCYFCKVCESAYDFWECDYCEKICCRGCINKWDNKLDELKKLGYHDAYLATDHECHFYCLDCIKICHESDDVEIKLSEFMDDDSEIVLK